MQAILFTLIPLAALVIGAITTTFANPGTTIRSAIQHFAAGVVFAAAAGEILPDVKHGGPLAAVLIGAAVGIVAMLVLKSFADKAKGPLGLATATAIDLVVDGMVLGIGFIAGLQQGVLLTIALTLEVLFLGLTLVGEFDESLTRWKAVGATCLIGLGLPLGALLGLPISTLPAAVQTAFYAFGLIALLYLVTEELLVEAHECPETPFATAMFFVGFMAILTLEQLMRH
jgi:ZIP family zinc transporter